jgi:hypothetical protein
MPKRSFVYLLILSALIIASCADSPDDPAPDPAPSPVPLPTSIYDPVFLATNVSAETEAGISAPIPDFTPYVLEMYDWNGTYNSGYRVFDWIPQNKQMTLVEDGSINYFGWQLLVGTEPPRLKHTRYWRKIFSVILGENTEYSEAHSVTYGISETEGREFSVTVGMEADAWFVTMKAEITASFSYDITHSSETSTSKTFTAQGAEGKDTVFTVWQRVNRFYLCDSNGTTLRDDKDVLCDRLHLRDDKYYFEEASESEYFLSTAMFDK